jgi:hypothetical protein
MSFDKLYQSKVTFSRNNKNIIKIVYENLLFLGISVICLLSLFIYLMVLSKNMIFYKEPYYFSNFLEKVV